MKPVKNKSKSFFEIGKYYLYKPDDHPFILKSINTCHQIGCNPSSCNHLYLLDTTNREWCSIEHEFLQLSHAAYLEKV